MLLLTDDLFSRDSKYYGIMGIGAQVLTWELICFKNTNSTTMNKKKGGLIYWKGVNCLESLNKKEFILVCFCGVFLLRDENTAPSASFIYLFWVMVKPAALLWPLLCRIMSTDDTKSQLKSATSAMLCVRVTCSTAKNKQPGLTLVDFIWNHLTLREPNMHNFQMTCHNSDLRFVPLILIQSRLWSA